MDETSNPVPNGAEQADSLAPADVSGATGTPGGEGTPFFGRVSLKRVPLALMILWSILTLGFYPYVWLVLRLSVFNSMGRSRIPEWAPYLLIGLHVLTMFAPDSGCSVVSAMAGFPLYFMLKQLFGLILFAVNVAVSFKLRRILKEYAGRPGCPVAPEGVAPGAFMTFFFGALYLQHHINRMIYVRAVEARS